MLWLYTSYFQASLVGIAHHYGILEHEAGLISSP
jgi:hypothetical protein